MKNLALVTGGRGFLGRAVVHQLLDQGWVVRILNRGSAPDLEAKGVDCIQGDIRDGETVVRACKGVKVIHHTAALAGIWGPREWYEGINLTGTRNVIRAALDNGVEAIIHTSTPSVVFNRRSHRGGDESLPYGSRWLCHYAETKRLAEEEMLQAHQAGKLLTVALRPHLIFGPGDNHLIPRLIQAHRDGRLKQVGDGQNQVDMTYIDTAAMAQIKAQEALLAGRTGGKAYFISQGEPIVLWDWIRELLEKLGEQPLKKKVPLGVAYTAGGILEGIWKIFGKSGEPPMTRFVALQLATSHTFSIAAARRDLNFEPPITMQEGTQRLVESLK